jgi:hypothetical protein
LISKPLSAFGGILIVSGVISIYSFVKTNYDLGIVISVSVGFSIVMTLAIVSLIGLTNSIFSIKSGSEELI